MRRRVQLLGHIIGGCVVHTDQDKEQKIRDAHPLGDTKDLISVLGSASYYRQLIKLFAKIASAFSGSTLEQVDCE